MATTLKDLALACKMDISTVSRALRDDPRVKKVTRDRIKDIAADMGYRPNLAARTLVAGRSKVIWFMLPYLHASIEQEPAQYASLYLSQFGYDLMVVLHQNNDSVYCRLIERLSQGVADGAIIIPGPLTWSGKYVESLLAQNYPLVFLDRYPPEVKTPKVVNDNAGSAAELVCQAKNDGNKGMLVLLGATNNAESMRRKGALDELKKQGMRVFFEDDLNNKSKVAELPDNLGIIASGQSWIVEFIHRHPEFVNDRILTFCVWDHWFGEPHPAVNVYIACQDFKTMAEKACETVLAMINKDKVPQRIKVPHLRIDHITRSFK